MNKEGHEINDDSKTAELLNSFFKSAFNKRNEAKKYRQLGSNEDIAEIVLGQQKDTGMPSLAIIGPSPSPRVIWEIGQ